MLKASAAPPRPSPGAQSPLRLPGATNHIGGATAADVVARDIAPHAFAAPLGPGRARMPTLLTLWEPAATGGRYGERA